MAYLQPSAPEASPWFGPVRRIGGRVLDVLLPPQCLRCSALVDMPGTLCPACWRQLRFIDRPLCAACGVPFEADLGPGAVCGECARRPPAYERARAAVVYDDGSRPLILAFKHGDRTDAAPAFGRWMARAGADLIADADLIVPVPLHWTRLFTRRYNQAALLAHAIGRDAGVRVAPDLLVRHRRTRKLMRMGPTARRRVVQGAIGVHRGRRDLVDGRRILLIDDVHTSGATLGACTQALLRAGTAAVDVLTLARTLRTDPS